MRKRARSGASAVLAVSFLLTTITNDHAQCQQGYRLQPISGSDGVFETVILDGDTIRRAIKTNGTYALYMYFAAPTNVPAQTLYLEVIYKDTGLGSISAHYNSVRTDYRRANTRYQNYVKNSGNKRTAVFELRDANFRKAQNLSADLRLVTDGSFQMHIIAATVFSEPTSLFLKNHENWISPYSGPVYTGPDLVRADSINGKVVCGYQGWFRATGDPAEVGWVHYANGDFSDLTVEMWPDMQEYSFDEKYPIPGWQYANGDQAYVFSSANKRTVLRHFQWMRAYGIDCAAIQRFVPTPDDPRPYESYRIPGYAREAANRTGRTYYIMVNVLRKDWQFLVDSMKITQDSRYLHHNGKPVVGIFGFFPSIFHDTLIPNQVLDFFQKTGPYHASVAGSGMWWWRSETTPGWEAIIRLMEAYIPWNVGNYNGDYAQTGYWSEDKNAFETPGRVYMPLVFPGFGWDNLMNLPPGTSEKSRLKGEFMWRQFVRAKNIGAKAVYLAMFDEIDEGTAIFKIANEIPVGHYFQTLDGLPSDFYLLLTGFGNKLLRNEVTLPASMPDFAAESQPPVPEILSPSHGDTLNAVSISWTPVEHSSGIVKYELEVDNQRIPTTATNLTITLADGQHALRIQATNGLGNESGFSEPVAFTVINQISGMAPAISSVPDKFAVFQNYPNPFNPSTTIRYHIPRPVDVTIAIYNCLCERVALLVDEFKNAGRHDVHWQPTLPSGVYFCRVKAGAFSDTKKLMIMR